MKTYTKTIWNICACMLIILLGGCADDDIIRNDCGSTLQETESHLISTFSLPEGKTPIQDTREQIFFQLRSLSDNSIQLMEGKIRKNAGILSCEMFIPNNLVLAYIIHSGFISGYQNRYGDNLKPPTNVYHRMTA